MPRMNRIAQYKSKVQYKIAEVLERMAQAMVDGRETKGKLFLAYSLLTITIVICLLFVND